MAFDWCMVIAISSLPLWATEIMKAIRKRTGRYAIDIARR